MFCNAPEPREIKGALPDRGDPIGLHLIARAKMIGGFPITKKQTAYFAEDYLGRWPATTM
jgi:hypothetical protein